MQVLIVEDDWLLAEQLRAALAQGGHEIVGMTAEGVRALSVAETARPQVALVDVALADGLSGTTVGAYLARQGVAVIYLTGRVDEAVHDGRAHAVDILAKPYTPAELAQALARAEAQCLAGTEPS